jgi:sugar-specific transcriptional regulator TrmB
LGIGEVKLSQEQVLKTLLGLGLTRLDSQVYIYLAKKGPQKGRDLLKGLKIPRQQLYRSLKNLQSKGIVSGTFEHPARFTAISFDKILDLFIKSKIAEAQLIQERKSEILTSWQSISVGETTDSEAKFTVIEGRGYIYSKILQMIKETKKQLSTITSIAGLLRAEQFGVFDEIVDHPLKEEVDFQFITEVSGQNMSNMQKLLDRMPKNLSNIKGRNPDFGFKLSPRMVIRDEDEILLFINPLNDENLTEKDDVSLWTNCKTIVQSFSTMFEDLWLNSTDMTKTTKETTSLPNEIETIKDRELANERYCKALETAKEEIVMMTSSQGLIEISKNLVTLNECSRRGVLIQILAPVIKDNLEAAKKLQLFCKIRHIPTNYTEATVIDSKEFYQFRGTNQIDRETVFYSDNLGYIKKIANNLNNTWKTAIPLTDKTLESMLGPYSSRPSDFIMRRMKIDQIQIIEEKQKITEKEIVEKMLTAKRKPVKDISKDLHIMYASGGSAIVHPPESFNLPDLMFEIQHIDKHSGLGQADAITVFLLLDTPNGKLFVPAGGLGDNPKGVAFRKSHYAGFPASENHRLVRKNELEVRVHGNTLFAGWTVPMPLLPPKYVLPPACITIEGYGNVKTNAYTISLPSGFKNRLESNGFDAFVTFMHPASKYSGPGTDGFFIRDLVMMMTPPPEVGKSKVKELKKIGN